MSQQLLSIVNEEGDVLLSLSVPFLTDQQQAEIQAVASEPQDNDPQRDEWLAAQ